MTHEVRYTLYLPSMVLARLNTLPIRPQKDLLGLKVIILKRIVIVFHLAFRLIGHILADLGEK